MTSRISRWVLTPLIWASSAAAFAAAPPLPHFTFTQPAGPYAVGLKVVDQYDHSRVYRPRTDNLGQPVQGERARPLQTLVWYPATRTRASPVTVGDYVKLVDTETRFDKPDTTSRKPWITRVDPYLKAPMWAVRNAPAASGHYPVVIYAPSLSSTSWENADLCEYLASHGYVVIASPSLGVSTREMSDDLAGANAQAADISFLIGYAQTLADADVSEVAVAGFSWGGLANLFAAARDNRIDALVALDGSLRYFPDLVQKAADVNPGQMTLPLLYFTEGPLSIEKLAAYKGLRQKAPSVLNAWTHGDLLTVHMLGMVHLEFASMFDRNPVFWRGFHYVQKADYGPQDGMVSYGVVAQYTLKFLDAYLKHDALAMAYLKQTPARNGIPRHLVDSQFRAAQGMAPTLDAFRARLGRQGFAHASALYAEIRNKQPDFVLKEASMDAWGQALLLGGHDAESIAILKLNTEIYPRSTQAFESLGVAYAVAGKKQLALLSYRKALELDPGNTGAAGQLQLLEAGKPVQL